MKAIRKSIRESLSDDEIPLQQLKMNGYTEDPNSYDSLCQHSIQACEFCDNISKNRYSNLIHNVKHIIIPLLNQTVYQCEICLYHFTSKLDLGTHKQKKHPSEIIFQIDLVGEETLKIYEEIDSKFDVIVPKRENSVEIIEDESKNESIKNRLIFEDDIVLNCDQLLNDLTTECKVNLEVFDPPWLFDDEFKGKSVHFDDLIKPGFYRCKKCGMGFPIRYEAIIHESSHITFKNSQVTLCSICNQYILGNENHLKFHYLSIHKDKSCNMNTQFIQTFRQAQTYENCFENYIASRNRVTVRNYKAVKNKATVKNYEAVKNNTAFNNSTVVKNDTTVENNTYYTTVENNTAVKNETYYTTVENNTAVKNETYYTTVENNTAVKNETYFTPVENNTAVEIYNTTVKNYTPVKNNTAVKNYTNIKNNKAVNNKDSNNEGKCEDLVFKTLMLCDLCYKFCKSKKFMNYVCVGNFSQLGIRFPCEKCGAPFFELKLVRRQTKLRHHQSTHKKKKLTNEDRLKSIQQRFKMMKN